MGSFRVRIEVGDRQGERFEPLEALVDTGATYTWVPRSILERLGLQPEQQRPFITADGRQVSYGMAWTLVRLNAEAQPTLVVFGDEGTEPLLGVFTLEGFGLGVDAVNQRLIPTPGLLKRAAGGHIAVMPQPSGRGPGYASSRRRS
ncbi:MAG: retroviral-like aspartic protease family protein [Dehalococcoidia bacterium]